MERITFARQIPIFGTTITPAAAVGSWTTVYNWNAAGTTDDNAWNSLTVVAIIPFASFSATNGSRIRLTFDGATTEGFIASAMYIGNGGGGDAWDFGSAPVQMTMGASTTITVAAGATDTVTDDVAFTWNGSNTFVMAMQFQDGAHDNLRRTATGGGEVATSYYQSGADAATQNKASYNVNAGASYIKKIEMLI